MRRRPLWALGAGLVLVLALFAIRPRGPAAGGAPPGEQWDPLPRLVEVEVLNAGGTPGAARDVALRLRRARLDVVSWGNAPSAMVDTATRNVRILVRRGDTTGVGRVASALGRSDVVDAPDPSRLVDLTVLVPRSPPEP